MTEGSGRGVRGARTGSLRLPVTLACSECKARNYKTTKGAGRETALELKKYCKVCKRHTLHRETK